jgi:hypothetical protein
MTKTDYLKHVVNTFHSDLDNVFERYKVKLVLLFILKNNTSPVNVDITDENQTKTILQIKYENGEISKNYDKMQTESRRIFISDLYSCTSSFCIYLDNVLREKNDKGRHLPAFFDTQYNQPLSILNRLLKSDDKLFLTFLHNVRNSMIHYDGQYNKKNFLDYKILALEFKTLESNLGEQIIWGSEEMIEVYKRLKSIFAYDLLSNNPLFV